MIRLKGIRKVYQEQQKQTEVLSGVDLTVKKGDFLAIMGPSGAGKSTLLNIIGGLDMPTQGEYYFDKIPIHEMKPAKRNWFRKENIGFVFQNYSLLDDCTVYENVELPLWIRNVSAKERKQKVLDTLELFHIRQYAEKMPDALSGGEQQRCAIARAMVAGNKLLLADEPTGALDSETGIEIMEILSRLNREHNITVIIVTHDKNVADYANRITTIKDGKIIS